MLGCDGRLWAPYQDPLVDIDDGLYNSVGLCEALNYHNPLNYGYFAILARNDKGYMKQDCYSLSLLSQVLPLLNPKADTYIVQNEFKNYTRRVVNLLRICLCFLDLDIKLGTGLRLTGKINNDLDLLFDWHHNSCLPFPSMILFSGRGYHLKWFFERPIPARVLPRWNAVQKNLVKQYSELGADPKARDASRVLRVAGTVNSKNGEIATVIYPNINEDTTVFEFESFAEEILPYSRRDIENWKEVSIAKQKEREKRGKRPASNLNLNTLNWARLWDLRALMNIRKIANGGTVPEGQRMSFLFWLVNFLALSGATTPELMRYEAATLGKEIDPGWGYRSEELSTVYYKMVNYCKGEKIEFKGRTYPPLYTPKNETLIDSFEITNDEMEWMHTIISREKANQRHQKREEIRRRAVGEREREDYLDDVRVAPEVRTQAHRERDEARRRAAGEREREDYLESEKAKLEAKIEQAIILRAKGLNYRAIADEMGVSVASVSSYLKDQ
jgi:hypothetical protein